MKIVVLAGGYSHERDVSLASGCLIANALCRQGHRVALVDVYENLETEDLSSLFSDKGGYSTSIPQTVPDLRALKAERHMGNKLIGDRVLHLCMEADLVFLALHGGMGEDGRIQSVLECYGIPFTGSSFGPCFCAMEKNVAKDVMRAAGIPVPGGFVYAGEPEEEIALPCVVKPASLGSSVGVSLVDTAEELHAALTKAVAYGVNVLIEEKIPGREFSCGVLDGTALPPIEIRPKEGFYDYERKYQSGLTEEICPAPLSDSQTARIRDLAERAHRALGLSVYSRLDFILDERTGDFVCLEANTLPGMTPTSLLPQEAAAVGISYDELVERIASLSLKK
ncbi:MAG: D-alanine--D-alanine ligase [Ruminococcus sp.]|nr:D-alanine--D-alanine ligase [Candidatus Apopatosoma intestinale]